MFEIIGSALIPIGMESEDAMVVVKENLEADSANRVEYGKGVLRFQRPELSGSRLNKFVFVSGGVFAIQPGVQRSRLKYRISIERLWFGVLTLCVCFEGFMYLSYGNSVSWRRALYLPFYFGIGALVGNYVFVAVATKLWLMRVLHR